MRAMPAWGSRLSLHRAESADPAGALLVGVSHREVGLCRAHGLHAHGSPVASKPTGMFIASNPAGGADDHFHSAMAGIHRAPGSSFWPCQLCVEREHLSTGEEQVVVTLEQLLQGVVPRVTLQRGLVGVASTQTQATLDFPDGLGLELAVMLSASWRSSSSGRSATKALTCGLSRALFQVDLHLLAAAELAVADRLRQRQRVQGDYFFSVASWRRSRSFTGSESWAKQECGRGGGPESREFLRGGR